jgi:cardiolipin synthase
MPTARVLAAGRWAAVFILVCLVVGCNSLPRIHPDMAPSRAPAVEVAGAGPLSAARSKEVLAALKKHGQETGIFERHLALEEAVAGTPLVTGNKVVLLQDGPATYAAMLVAIREARDHIDMESYIFDDDATGERFSQALLARQRQGVQVNLIYDAVGALHTSPEFFKPLTDAGAKVLQFNPVNPLEARAGWNVNQRDHRKLLITDGRIAFLGGINISGVYSNGSKGSTPSRKSPDGLPWRDTQLQVEGPVVADFQKLFLETWQHQKGDPLPRRNYFPTLPKRGNHVVRAIGGSPDEPYSAIYATLISAIDSAETEILLSNAYFAPDPQLREALKNAVRRGVEVRLLLPSKTDSALIFHAGRSYYDELLEAGIKIYERKAALLHSKTALIDGVWSTIGSTNLDWRSFLHNQELNAVVLGADFGNQMKAAFERDLAESQPITLEQWRQRGLGFRMKEAWARMWEYWL